MYILSVKDKKDKELELYKTKSQKEMDEFTTCFYDEKALLDMLNLDSKSFKIRVYQSFKDNKTDLRFTNSKYRNVVYLNENVDKDEKFISKACEQDREMLYDYYLNELLRFEKDSLSQYEDERYAALLRIINYFENDEDDIDYDGSRLVKYSKIYLRGNYSYLKSLYSYLISLGLDLGCTYERGTKDKVLSKIKAFNEKIDKELDRESNLFIEERKKVL